MSENSERHLSKHFSYWQKIGRSVGDTWKMHKASGQWAKGLDSWRNIPKHCLVQVARTGELGTWIGLPDPLITEMKAGSALHDFHKRPEITATRDANRAGISPLAAVRSEQEKGDNLLREAGFSSRVRRLANSVGGDAPQLIEAQRILDQETLSDEDWAYLIVRYVDDCSIGDDWILPSRTGADGKRVNIIDYRMQQQKAKGDYNIISQEISNELLPHRVLGRMRNVDAAAFVSHQIEQRLAKRIMETIGTEIDPITIPELIDQRIREAIEETA